MPFTPGVHFLEPTIPLYVFEAREPGPTALIQAGIHGDEVAGVHALQELLEAALRPSHGRLLVCPVMNPRAYRARERAAPGGLDLNRMFPGDADSPEWERRLARKFMDLVEDERPALMVTLHESKKRYDPSLDYPTFGQTIVYGVEPRPEIVDRTLARLNARFDGEQEHWDPHYFPVATSSTEVIVDAIGCVGLCIETWMGFEEARRIEMQKAVVEYLLDDVGVRRLG
ncbi:succinylglutamate desuccinylase/aspartoacylase family protein [Pseudenhygromyxa sp. WMMC2535]|uniref:M14 family zinc carboxypeptidase n=1 Tax=Pseudenhygromyxa sp. WMMC2535 TaxID=2712867 RepID=UPI00155767BE|nr:succinylglutamate desuccinylase/aspartoacylase family protein [Pseudenhygromyxa sp. WMMC2535]NVB40063.1 succinylglutamate desuccinylase/aspartoacylase family protein [Pseudenhygromyxa sp. WMMC2535]